MLGSWEAGRTVLGGGYLYKKNARNVLKILRNLSVFLGVCSGDESLSSKPVCKIVLM